MYDMLSSLILKITELYQTVGASLDIYHIPPSQNTIAMWTSQLGVCLTCPSFTLFAFSSHKCHDKLECWMFTMSCPNFPNPKLNFLQWKPGTSINPYFKTSGVRHFLWAFEVSGCLRRLNANSPARLPAPNHTSNTSTQSGCVVSNMFVFERTCYKNHWLGKIDGFLAGKASFFPWDQIKRLPVKIPVNRSPFQVSPNDALSQGLNTISSDLHQKAWKMTWRPLPAGAQNWWFFQTPRGSGIFFLAGGNRTKKTMGDLCGTCVWSCFGNTNHHETSISMTVV